MKEALARNRNDESTRLFARNAGKDLLTTPHCKTVRKKREMAQAGGKR